jgi:hypothetical protein
MAFFQISQFINVVLYYFAIHASNQETRTDTIQELPSTEMGIQGKNCLH